MCVMSLEGSLVSYKISKTHDQTYEAVLKSEGRKQAIDIPVKFTLTSMKGNWKVDPENNDIVPALIQCIEANN
jgi:hypothetical protein